MAKKEGYHTNIQEAQNIFRNITAGTVEVVS